MSPAKRAHLARISALGVLGRRDRTALAEARTEAEVAAAVVRARAALTQAHVALGTLPPTPLRWRRREAIAAALGGLEGMG